MNTIKEILKKKNINTFEIYSKVICQECNNKNNDEEKKMQSAGQALQQREISRL